MALETLDVVALAVLEILDLVALAVLDFLAVQLLEAQSPYRLQLVRSCHLVLFYHRALFNNQVHIFLLE